MPILSISLRPWDLGGRSVLGRWYEEGFHSLRGVDEISYRAAAWRDGLYVRGQYRVHVIRTLLRFSYSWQQQNESRDRRVEQAP